HTHARTQHTYKYTQPHTHGYIHTHTHTHKYTLHITHTHINTYKRSTPHLTANTHTHTHTHIHTQKHHRLLTTYCCEIEENNDARGGRKARTIEINAPVLVM